MDPQEQLPHSEGDKLTNKPQRNPVEKFNRLSLKDKVEIARKFGPVAVGFTVEAYASIAFYSQPHTLEEGVIAGFALVGATLWLGSVAYKELKAAPTPPSRGVTITINVEPAVQTADADTHSYEQGYQGLTAQQEQDELPTAQYPEFPHSS